MCFINVLCFAAMIMLCSNLDVCGSWVLLIKALNSHTHLSKNRHKVLKIIVLYASGKQMIVIVIFVFYILSSLFYAPACRVKAYSVMMSFIWYLYGFMCMSCVLTKAKTTKKKRFCTNPVLCYNNVIAICCFFYQIVLNFFSHVLSLTNPKNADRKCLSVAIFCPSRVHTGQGESGNLKSGLGKILLQ